MSTISVIIPAYNSERTILETITSVQQQTFSDFELIVINDGSTDRTLELVENVKDPRIKVFSYENNGVSVTRNRGIDCATGEFITFLDADDLWTPDKLELQLAALQKNPEAGVAYSWTSCMGEKKEWFSPCGQVFFEGNVYADLIASYFIMSGSNSLIRRQAIESEVRFDPTLTHGEDWDFHLRLAARWSFVVVPKEQIFYRQSSTSAVSNIEALHKSNLLVLERAFQAASLELKPLRNKCFATVYLYSAEQYLKKRNDIDSVNKALHCLWMVNCLYPQTKKNLDFIKWSIKKWVLLRFFPKKCNDNEFKS